MRLYEFANAQEQLALWKLISDSVWNSISAQAQAQEQKRATDAKAANKARKSSPSKSSAKRVSPPTPPKPRTLPKKTDSKTDSKTDAEAKQKSASQTQKPQVLPKVFTSTARSNPAQPQSPVTSASSLSDQNAAKTRYDGLRDRLGSVASVQRQLDPLASSEVVKRLTS
jgi:hypothetical protein